MPIVARCLLVDDLDENLLALSALLRQDGVDVITAKSGIEALDLLLRHDIALAIVDVQMPEMDGFELAELMRGSERTRHVPLILVTAGSHDRRRVFKGYDAGAVDFLYKPIDPHILKNKADVFFQLYRQKVQLERDLHEKTETLRLNEMFAAVLGHDLRSPLGAIVTSAEILKYVTDPTAVREVADRIGSSAQRMNRMIQDMLDLARARLGGGIPINPMPMELGTIVARVVDECRTAFPGRSVELTTSGDLTGTWDGDRLAQVASNLIRNALQHGCSNSPVGVHISSAGADGVTLVVANAGALDPSVLPQLFAPFRGGERRAGLGLGLYIAQQIVHAHDGHIALEPMSADHTAFKVALPRRSDRQEHIDQRW